MTISRNFLFGVAAGLVVISFIGYDFYSRSISPSVALPLVSPLPPNLVTAGESDTTAPFVASASTSPAKAPSAKPVSTKPTSTPKPSLTPTPKPKIDYYLQSSSQILLPENTSGVTEYTQTQTYPKMRFEADFAVSNAAAGDTVELKIYEDGVIQQIQTQQVFSPNNFHFADVYYAKARSVGSHSVKFVYNENRAVEESNYDNNEATFTFKINAENVPPTFTIDGPYLINGQTCFRWIDLQDNVSVYTDVWAKWKIDDGNWSNRTSENPYGCITANPGTSHTYYVHAEDFAGNVREGSKTFTVY